MNRYLLSTLRKRWEGPGRESLQAVHPHPWLVWEPGQWMPSATGRCTTYLSLPAVVPARASGEALAIELQLPEHKRVLVVGRGEGADVVINDATLSRQHLALSRTPAGNWSLSELCSTNGTWIDGVRLNTSAVILHEGTRIQAGAVVLTFHHTAGLMARLQAPVRAAS
jgi:hypothetical protein